MYLWLPKITLFPTRHPALWVKGRKETPRWESDVQTLCQCFPSGTPSIFVHLCVFGENSAKFYHLLLKIYWVGRRKSTHLLQDYSTDGLYRIRKLAFAKHSYSLLSLFLSFKKGYNFATAFISNFTFIMTQKLLSSQRRDFKRYPLHSVKPPHGDWPISQVLSGESPSALWVHPNCN